MCLPIFSITNLFNGGGLFLAWTDTLFTSSGSFMSCCIVTLTTFKKNHSSSFSYLLFLMFDSNVLDIFMGKISSQVTKQKERCKHNFVFSLAHSFYQISFQFLFIQKYIRYFLITFLQISLLQVKSNLQKFHRQNILVHAWGDIKILLLEMKVQLGNVALNIWKWHFLTRLLLLSNTALCSIRKVL